MTLRKKILLILTMLLSLILAAIFSVIQIWKSSLSESLEERALVAVFDVSAVSFLIIAIIIPIFGITFLAFEWMVIRPIAKLKNAQSKLESGDMSEEVAHGVVTNVSELKRTEESLTESEERFRSTFEQAAVGIAHVSPDGRFMRINQRFCDIIGYAPHEMISLTFQDITHPADLQADLDHVRELIEGRIDTYSLEKRYICKDGSLVWVNLTVSLFREPSGEPKYFISVIEDIGKRKEAEEAQARLIGILDGTSDLIAMAKPDKCLSYMNQAGRAMIGWGNDVSITGHAISDVHPAWALKITNDVGVPTAIEKGIWVGESALLRFDGTEIPVSQVIIAHKSSAGELLYLSTIMRDITESKQVEELLRLNKKRVESLLELNLMTGASESELTHFAMEAAVRLTNSSIGYIAFVNEDETVLTMYAWSEDAMRQCAVENKPIEYKVSETGLWGEAIRQRRAVITNDYAAPNPLKKGVPEGHIPVIRHMNVPIFDGDRIVLVAGVGNKSTQYGDDDVRQLTLLMSDLWTILRSRRAEEELRKLALVVQNSSELVNLSSLDGQMIFLNEAGSKMLGISPLEVDQYSILDIIPENLRVLVQDKLIPTLMSKGSWEGDLQYRHIHTGALTDVHAMTFAIQDAKTGAPIFLANVSIDITERKRAEEMARKRHDELLAIFNGMGEPVYVSDPQTYEIVYANQILRDLFGPITGRKCYEYLQHRDDPCPFCTNDRIFGENLGNTYIWEFQNEVNGRWYQCNDRAIAWPDGRSLRLEITTDITERKLAEAQLSLQSLVLDQIQDCVTVTDLDGVITYVNDAEVRTLGYSREEMIGVSTEKYGEAPELGATQREILEETLKHEAWRGEVVNRTIDGREIILDCRTQVVLDAQGNRVALAGIGTDITERKRAELEREKLQAQLAQAQKMESVGRLAGGVAHDFNNMLGVILGRTEIALRRVAVSEPVYADLKEIQKAGERSADLICQLLAFARKQTIAPKEIDLNEKVTGMLNMLQRLIGENIELLWKPSSKLWLVKMDPSQIDQILLNLCVNAKDAITGVGKVSVETRNAVFDERDCAGRADLIPGDYVMLAVNDNGCGMDAETVSQIFEPFFSTKKMGKGTGLGLATVYGAVKQNNGFINVYSEPGLGTTFKIYLPRYVMRGDMASSESSIATPVLCGQETILLVEDEPMILDLTTTMLEDLGYRVIAASTPGEAIRLAREHSGCIDLLMTDVVMPEMNGRDLAKNLLSIYPSIKRLFMSGYTANVIAHQGVLEEGVNFIQKPFSMKGLAAKLREVLGNG